MKPKTARLMPIPPKGTYVMITEHEKMPSIVGRIGEVVQVPCSHAKREGWAFSYVGVWLRLLGNDDFEYNVRLDGIMWDDLEVRSQAS